MRDQAVSAAERGERVRAVWASVCVRASGVARAEPGRKGAGPRREGVAGPRGRPVGWIGPERERSELGPRRV